MSDVSKININSDNINSSLKEFSTNVTNRVSSVFSEPKTINIENYEIPSEYLGMVAKNAFGTVASQMDRKTVIDYIGEGLEQGWDNLRESAAYVTGGWRLILGQNTIEDFDEVMDDVRKTNAEDHYVADIGYGVSNTVEKAEYVGESFLLDFNDLIQGDISGQEYLDRTGSKIEVGVVSTIEGAADFGRKVQTGVDWVVNDTIGNIFVAGGWISEEDKNSEMEKLKDKVIEDENLYQGEKEYLWNDTAIGKSMKEGAGDTFDEIREIGNIGGNVVASTAFGPMRLFRSTGDYVNQAASYGCDPNEITLIAGIGTSKEAIQFFLPDFNDFVDGASDEIVDRGIFATFVDGYTDPTSGEWVEFSSADSWADRFSKISESRGGYVALGEQAASAALTNTAIKYTPGLKNITSAGNSIWKSGSQVTTEKDVTTGKKRLVITDLDGLQYKQNVEAYNKKLDEYNKALQNGKTSKASKIKNELDYYDTMIKGSKYYGKDTISNNNSKFLNGLKQIHNNNDGFLNFDAFKSKKNNSNDFTDNIDVENKLNRYNELMKIANTDEYKQYMKNAELGYAQRLRSDFDAVEAELNQLKPELDEYIKRNNYLNGESTTEELPELQAEIKRQEMQLKQNQKSASMTLKNEILSNIDLSLDPLSKARSAYIELNKRINYDPEFHKSDDIGKQKIFNSVHSFNDLDGTKVVCSGWSELYAEILIDCGFSKDNVHIMGNNKHKWVEIEINGNIVIADATDVINHSTDLANCKAGFKTNGFVYLDQSYSGKRLSSINFSSDDEIKINKLFSDINDVYNNRKIVSQADYKKMVDEYNKLLSKKQNVYSLDLQKVGEEQFRDIDKCVGYNRGKYSEETIKKASVFKKIFVDKNLNEFFDKNYDKIIDRPIPNYMGGYEAYAYYNMITRLLSVSDNYNIHYDYYKLPNGKYDAYTSVTTSTGQFRGMIYSDSFGKIEFNDIHEYDSYIKSLGWWKNEV